MSRAARYSDDVGASTESLGNGTQHSAAGHDDSNAALRAGAAGGSAQHHSGTPATGNERLYEGGR